MVTTSAGRHRAGDRLVGLARPHFSAPGHHTSVNNDTKRGLESGKTPRVPCASVCLPLTQTQGSDLRVTTGRKADCQEF